MRIQPELACICCGTHLINGCRAVKCRTRIRDTRMTCNLQGIARMSTVGDAQFVYDHLDEGFQHGSTAIMNLKSTVVNTVCACV